MSESLLIPIALDPCGLAISFPSAPNPVGSAVALDPCGLAISFPSAPNPVGSAVYTLSDINYPQNSGIYRITGTVKKLGKEGKYRLRLFDIQSSICVRETWSALVDGSYSFDCISDTAYFVAVYDHGDNQINAAFADKVTSVNFDLGATTGTTAPKMYYGSIPIPSILVG